jgi:integrating conjugative element relaxase (TIGR03760 family)
MKFWRKSKSASSKTQLDLKQLDLNKLPILKAQDIIALLGLEKRFKSIEKLAGAGSEYFQLLYTPALHQYIESVQLAPASAFHHHAGPGGLVIHTLDVIDHALRKRKSYNLPQQSTPEVIAQQEHVWTYAIFAGALLHDIGKLVCNTKLVLETGAVWTPHHASILESGATHYKVLFERAEYKLHTRLSNGFLHLLPPRGRGWLAQFPDILAQLTGWLAGEAYDWGVIGEIVRQADGESVAKNLKLGGDRNRFPNAPSVPLVDKLTTALRQLLDEGQLKINRRDGSAGWCDGLYTYLVCGTVADAVRSHLLSAGATEVPVDNSRIFDTWQEHGFVHSTPDGGAIWHLTINEKLTLTVLKFETGRIFHPSRRPEAFTGQLAISANKPIAHAASKTATPLPSPTEGVEAPNASHAQPNKDEAERALTESVGSPNTSSTQSNRFEPENDEPQSVGTPNTQVEADNEASKNHNNAPNQTHNSHVKSFYMADEQEPTSSSDHKPAPNSPQNARDAPKSLSLDDSDIGLHFLNWIKSGLQENRIMVNRSDALLHTVKEGVLIVSPKAFKLFARQFSLVESSDEPKERARLETQAATKIQKRLERLMSKDKLHRKTKNGMNIHTYLVQGEHKESKIRGWLLPISVIYGDGQAPEPNPVLMNLSGFKGRTQSKKNSDYFLGLDS